MYADVLVATDGSEGADHAVELADRFGAHLHALSVAGSRSRAAGVEAATAHAAAREHLAADAEAALEAVRARADAAGVPVAVEYDEGSPVAVILDRAARADLAVLGTHGRTGLDRFLLGSLARRAVRLKLAPTLVVPPGGGDEDGGG